jgi:hypothetical protein
VGERERRRSIDATDRRLVFSTGIDLRSAFATDRGMLQWFCSNALPLKWSADYIQEGLRKEWWNKVRVMVEIHGVPVDEDLRD